MNKLLNIIIALIICGTVSAGNNDEIKKEEYKLNYEEFINEYGADDTSYAIIELFFEKRQESAAGQMSFLPISAALTPAVPVLGAGAMVVSTPFFINGIIVQSKYSKKKLIAVLNEYKETGHIDRKYQKKINRILDEYYDELAYLNFKETFSQK